MIFVDTDDIIDHARFLLGLGKTILLSNAETMQFFPLVSFGWSVASLVVVETAGREGMQGNAFECLDAGRTLPDTRVFRLK